VPPAPGAVLPGPPGAALSLGASPPVAGGVEGWLGASGGVGAGGGEAAGGACPLGGAAGDVGPVPGVEGLDSRTGGVAVAEAPESAAPESVACTGGSPSWEATPATAAATPLEPAAPASSAVAGEEAVGLLLVGLEGPFRAPAADAPRSGRAGVSASVFPPLASVVAPEESSDWTPLYATPVATVVATTTAATLTATATNEPPTVTPLAVVPAPAPAAAPAPVAAPPFEPTPPATPIVGNEPAADALGAPLKSASPTGIGMTASPLNARR
jgi:hypothetical protein